MLKLFDRSVDLAQFEESSSLYPVCRAWIKNQPHNRDLGIRERTPTPEPEVFGLPEDVSILYRVNWMCLFPISHGNNVLCSWLLLVLQKE